MNECEIVKDIQELKMRLSALESALSCSRTGGCECEALDDKTLSKNSELDQFEGRLSKVSPEGLAGDKGVKVHHFNDIKTGVVELNNIVATYFPDGKLNISFKLLSKEKNNSWPVHRITDAMHLELLIKNIDGGVLYRWDIAHLRWGCTTNAQQHFESNYPANLYEMIEHAEIPGTTFSTNPKCS